MINHICLNLPTIDLSSYDTKWTWGDDLRLLAYLASLRTNGNIIEIGCNEGRTTKFLADQFPHLSIVGIDWTGVPTMCEGEMPCKVDKDSIGRMVRNRTNVTIHDAISWEFNYSAYSPISLIFIDGDHQFDAVKKDTDHAIKMIKHTCRPAYIAWHDAKEMPETWNGVMRYLSGLDLNIFIPKGTMTAFSMIHAS
jgi:predicted O-methyltransferase YrrM